MTKHTEPIYRFDNLQTLRSSFHIFFGRTPEMLSMLSFHGNIVSRLIRLFCWIVISLQLQGCTLMLWRNPSISYLEIPQLLGVETLPQANATERCILRVEYSKHYNTIRFWMPGGMKEITNEYAIPLYNGLPPGELGYHGPHRTPEAILQNLSPGEIKRISQYKFPKGYARQSETLSFPGAVAFIAGGNLPRSYKGMDNDGQPAFRLYAYRLDGGNLNIIDASDSRRELDPGCQILLLPERQKRPFSERIGGMTLALIATPVTLVVDTPVIATVFFLVYLDKITHPELG